MLKSMTAFGRASLHTPLGRFVAELHSVNRKHLEINVLLPKELTRFDIEIKKWISAAVVRGQINVRISAHFDTTSPIIASPNLPLAKQLKEAWEKIIHSLQLDRDNSLSLELLAHESKLICYEEDIQDESLYREALHQVIEEALKPFLLMKKTEGEALFRDISTRVELLKTAIRSIAEKTPEATVKYRQKLTQRLEEILAGSVENEERVLREVSIYAEKIDIAEEITRFDIHLAQFLELIHSETPGIGKTMEFLIQELNREANTISSKSSDVSITHLIVTIKSELERIREQIQNIE